MVIIKVRMEASANGAIREVNVPDERIEFFDDIEEALGYVFHFGQNDFQPRHLPSVSVGDVILFGNGDGDKEYRVDAVGFTELCNKCTLEDMCYPCWCNSYYKDGETMRHKHALDCKRCE